MRRTTRGGATRACATAAFPRVAVMARPAVAPGRRVVALCQRVAALRRAAAQRPVVALLRQAAAPARRAAVMEQAAALHQRVAALRRRAAVMEPVEVPVHVRRSETAVAPASTRWFTRCIAEAVT